MRMFSRRNLSAILLFLLVGSTVGFTAGLGIYYRSDAHRATIQSRLNDFFGLPVEIGGVSPDTLTSRRLSEIRIWLPDRRSQILDCPRAVWNAAGESGTGGASIHIYDPVLLIGADSWEHEDYMRVLRASLAHNFNRLDVHEVFFHEAKIRWTRRDLQLSMEGVEGRIEFDAAGAGHAQFEARSINGLPVTDPIQIEAKLAPAEREFVREVILTVPPLPLSGLGLEPILLTPISQGSFAGRITVRPSNHADEIELKGEARQIQLSEITKRLAEGPISGQLDLIIDRALIRGRQLEEIHFSGQVRQLQINSLAPHLQLPLIGGTVHLLLNEGEARGESIEKLTVSGEWTGGSLDTLCRTMLGRGGMRGQLRISINSLLMEHGEVVGGDIDLIATPPDLGHGAISRDLLSELLQKGLGLSLPAALLPEEIEFVQIGAKLIIKDGQVRVLSQIGPAGPALLTARVLGTLVPLLVNVDEKFPLRPLMERIRGPIAQVQQTVKSRLRPMTAASRPVNTSASRPAR
jgi:hypothetical protein